MVSLAGWEPWHLKEARFGTNTLSCWVAFFFSSSCSYKRPLKMWDICVHYKNSDILKQTLKRYVQKEVSFLVFFVGRESSMPGCEKYLKNLLASFKLWLCRIFFLGDLISKRSISPVWLLCQTIQHQPWYFHIHFYGNKGSPQTSPEQGSNGTRLRAHQIIFSPSSLF